MDLFTCELRFEDDGRDSPGRLAGTLITMEQPARDRPEVFTRGALTWPDGGIVINEMHNRMAPVVRALPFLEGDEWKIDVALPDTTRGRDIATAMRQDLPLYTGLSVEFKALAEGRRGNLREIRRAYCPSAGLVDRGAYAGSTVEVREGLAIVTGPGVKTLWL